MTSYAKCFAFYFIVLVSTFAMGRESSPLFGPFPPQLKLLGKHVTFGLTDHSKKIVSQHYILPKFTVAPYRQWNENNGYCGELSSIQAGMGAGQWMSQLNARLICGAGLSQSGPDGFCAAHNGNANYNSQFLFEDPNPGDEPFASAATCLANAHLDYKTFDYRNESEGMDGYKEFMSWVKSRVIAGDTVAIGVLNRGGSDPQYDHEVTVSQIGTNHSATDPSYYDDDVLYFEDHGDGGPAFNQGFSFASLAGSRKSANAVNANIYSILIPGGSKVNSSTGGDGSDVNPNAITPTNYGFAVSGPVDPQRETLPVTIAIVGSSLKGVANKPDTSVGFNFESPEIGQESNVQCTNIPPTWMGVSLKATVTGLTPGIAYSLYEYDFSQVSGFESGAALNLPDSNFNANAYQATKITNFIAQSTTFSQTIQTTSDKVVIFRCVSADAP
jgi:hypothetical protein